MLYNHYLYYYGTVANSTKYKLTFNNSMAERLITICFSKDSALNN